MDTAKKTKLFKISEVFNSYQGEGTFIGRKALFIRFAGCNYWDGTEENRAKSICTFCDTDFTENFKVDFKDLVDLIKYHIEEATLIVLTGGEPLLQLTSDDLSVLMDAFPNITIALETNGSIDTPIPVGIHLVVSPKVKGKLNLKWFHECKVVLPGGWADSKQVLDLFSNISFNPNYIAMPEDGGDIKEFWKIATELTKKPGWRIGIQAHKYWNIK